MDSRLILVAALLASGCASLPAPQEELDAQVNAVLDRRGLGADALRVVDNLVRHGPPAPPSAPALVLELLARPLDAADAASVFKATVPRSLDAIGQPAGALPLDELLKGYLLELERAQQLLGAAVPRFDEDAVLGELRANIASPHSLLAIAGAVDAAQLRRANQLFIEATARLASALKSATGWTSQTLDTPWGRIVVGTSGNDIHDLSPARAGRFSIVIDPGGDDEYRGSDVAVNGFSAIVDLGGNDRYAIEGPGLAAAIAGAALLVDLEGDDLYEARYFAQGAAAVHGFAALIDLAGNDRYRLEAWGQGFGMGDGVGLLWDRAGNDGYTAGGVPDPFGRAGGLSGAQGAGFGHRGRLAGGIGILRDDQGDDRYEAQMFAQGLGYYYALGLLWDRSGNDVYRALQYAQGNGVHQAIGVLREEAGSDRYEVASGYAQGMGLDIAVGILVDGRGDDAYRAQTLAQGSATANGLGLLADREGADRYVVAASTHAWGHGEWLRALPTVAVLLQSPQAQFTPPRPGERGVAVQPMTATANPAQSRASGGQSCTARALALRASPALAAAEEALRSPCYRLQAAGVAVFRTLGVAVPADAPLPTFLRSLPPQEDTD